MSKLEALCNAVQSWLDDNDPTDFGCCCEPPTHGTTGHNYPGHTCSSCSEHRRQLPLRKALEEAMK